MPRAQDDFYQFVNREQLRKAKMIKGFEQFSESVVAQVKIYKQLSSLPRMDNSPFTHTLHAKRRTNPQGTALTVLHQIQCASDKLQIMKLFGLLHSYGCYLFFTSHANPDFQGPNEILYFEEQEPVEISETECAKLCNLFHVQSEPKQLLKMYNNMIKFIFAECYTFTQKKDVFGCYNPQQSNFQWFHLWCEAAQVQVPSIINFDNPKTYTLLEFAFENKSIEEWRCLLMLAWMNHCEKLFSKTGKDFTQTAASAWWQDAGHQYAAHFVNPESHHMASLLVDEVRSFFIQRIEHADLHPTTRDRALEKLQKLKIQLGFINNAPPAQPLTLDSFDECCFAGWRYQLQSVIARTDHLPNPRQWREMGFHIYNGFFITECNEIFLTAAIFADLATSDLPTIFGNHVRVIAHEIAHCLDSQARLVNAEGKIENWWKPADDRVYRENQDKLTALCQKYGINSELTMTENIADIISLQIAYQMWLSKNPSDQEKIDFFIAYAKAQICKMQPSDAKNRLENDSHAPDHIRVNLPLACCPEFCELFHVRKTDKMWISRDKIPQFF